MGATHVTVGDIIVDFRSLQSRETHVPSPAEGPRVDVLDPPTPTTPHDTEEARIDRWYNHKPIPARSR